MTEYLNELARIRANIEETLTHVAKDKLLAKQDQRVADHLHINEKSFRMLLKNLQVGEQIPQSSLPSIQLTYISIWLDVQYWITKLGCFCERIILMIRKSNKIVEMFGDEFPRRSNCFIWLSFVLSRFLEYSAMITPPLVWIRDEQLMRGLADATKNIYIDVFSTLEESIVSIYLELIKQNKIPPVDTELKELQQLCEQLSLSKDEIGSNLDGLNRVIEKIQKKIGKMVEKEHPQFSRIISHLSKFYTLTDDRKNLLNHWLFFLHTRNSLLHKKGWGTIDLIIQLWGRNYKIVKNQPFELYHDSSYPILLFRLIELYVDLVLRISEENNLTAEWLEIKIQYLDIRVSDSR